MKRKFNYLRGMICAVASLGNFDYRGEYLWNELNVKVDSRDFGGLVVKIKPREEDRKARPSWNIYWCDDNLFRVYRVELTRAGETRSYQGERVLRDAGKQVWELRRAIEKKRNSR